MRGSSCWLDSLCRDGPAACRREQSRLSSSSCAQGERASLLRLILETRHVSCRTAQICWYLNPLSPSLFFDFLSRVSPLHCPSAPPARLPDRPSRDAAAKAAAALWSLADECIDNKHAVRELGGIPPLVALLDAGADNLATEKATGAIAFLADECDANKEAFVLAGAIPPLTRLFETKHNPKVTLLASIAMARLAELPGNQDAVVAAGGIRHLVSHIDGGDPESEMTLNAVESLVKMCDQSDAVREAVREGGGIPHLIKFLKVPPDLPVVESAATALARLSLNNMCKDEIRVQGGIPSLCALLWADPEQDVTARAAEALSVLCEGNASNCEQLRAADGLAPLVALLSCGPDASVSLQACACVGAMAGCAEADRNALRIAGVVPPLVALLGGDSSDHVTLLAASALQNLAASAESHAVIVEAGAVRPLVQHLARGAAARPPAGQAVPEAALALTVVCALVLARLAEAYPLVREQIRAEDGIRPLVGLLRSGGPDTAVCAAAAGALRSVAKHEPNRAVMLEAGVVPELVGLISAGPEHEASTAAAETLVVLCEGSDDSAIRVVEAGGVPALVDLLSGGAARPSTARAAGALAALAAAGKDVQRLIVQSAALPPLLLLVQTDFSDSVLAAAQAICALCDLAEARDALREMRGFNSVVALLGKGAENDAAGVAADTVAKLADADDVNRNWLREARDAIQSCASVFGSSTVWARAAGISAVRLRSVWFWVAQLRTLPARHFSSCTDLFPPSDCAALSSRVARLAQSFRSSKCSARGRRAQGRLRRRAR